jgi:hypothetical protein
VFRKLDVTSVILRAIIAVTIITSTRSANWVSSHRIADAVSLVSMQAIPCFSTCNVEKRDGLDTRLDAVAAIQMWSVRIRSWCTTRANVVHRVLQHYDKTTVPAIT